MRTDLIYLDNAATSWPKPTAVGEAMSRFLADHAGNPGRAGHRLSREAGEVVETARSRLAGMVGARDRKRLVLTHGCTDAVNLAIHGVLRGVLQQCDDGRPHVLMSAVEHNAVLRTLHCYSTQNLIELETIACDAQGRTDPGAFAAACKPETVLACLSHASNVLGTVQDVAATASTVHAKNPDVLFMVDAAQTVGHLRIDVEADGIDLLAIAGHKGLQGPTGTGGLYVGPRAFPDEPCDSRLYCQRRGGTGAIAPGLEMPTELPDALEAGTPNAVGFAGLLAAMDDRAGSSDEHELRLTQRIIDGLGELPNVTVYGPESVQGRMPVVLFNLLGHNPRVFGDLLDTRFGVCARGGIHCAPVLHKTICTTNDGGVRVSPGPANTDDEVDRFLEAVRVVAGEPAPGYETGPEDQESAENLS